MIWNCFWELLERWRFAEKSKFSRARVAPCAESFGEGVRSLSSHPAPSCDLTEASPFLTPNLNHSNTIIKKHRSHQLNNAAYCSRSPRVRRQTQLQHSQVAKRSAQQRRQNRGADLCGLLLIQLAFHPPPRRERLRSPLATVWESCKASWWSR